MAKSYSAANNAAKNRWSKLAAVEWGWTETVPDPQNPMQFIPNPETERQFAERHIDEMIHRVAMQRKRRLDAQAAEALVNDDNV